MMGPEAALAAQGFGSVALDGTQWLLTGIVLLGALPMAATVYQYVLLSVHRWFDHYDRCDPEYLPRVAVLVPAWNEEPVLRYSVDAMMALDYPPDRLQVAVVDDGSTDGSAELLDEKVRAYPGRVRNLRRANGGQGKAHTLNHGLEVLLADDWAEAVLITDADVVFEATSIRRLVRHLADEKVGAVTAFIVEASARPNWMNRYIGFEYTAAQAASRRAQNVVHAQGCLAGGAQLHSRANLLAVGGRIDTSTLAEDTVTTFETQLRGRRVIFDGNARCLAEEPDSVVGLWKQRLRWSRGNVQVARRFGRVFFHRSEAHRLGGLWFGVMWFSTLLLPAFMVLSSLALVALWFIDFDAADAAFRALWITSALGWVFTTTFTLLLDAKVARRTLLQATMFGGLISLVIMAVALVPRPMRALGGFLGELVGISQWPVATSLLTLATYGWVSLSMLAAYGVYRLEKTRWGKPLVPGLMLLVGYGPLLCVITFAAYVAEIRGASTQWEKTEKTGKVNTA